MRAFVLSLVCVFVLPCLMAASPESIVSQYGEVPGGVVLEGVARNFEDLKSVSYDKEKDEFVLNEKARYKNPLSRKDWVVIFRALKKDDLMGVSLSNGEPRVFGALSKSSEQVHNMIATDKLLGGIIYGLEQLVGDLKLPGGYKPKSVEKRKVVVIAFTVFTNYEFEKKQDRYALRDNSLNIQIIPLAKDKTDAGGHMADEATLQGFIMEESDRQNINHIKSMQAEYFKMEPIGTTNRLGEAAAFARLVRDTNIDHDELLKQMK